MPYLSVLSTSEVLFMTFSLQFSSLLGLPIIFYCFRDKKTYFEGCLFLMTLLASSLFHTCQIFETSLFLKELQWQRIDNIFTISSFQIVILHLFGAICGEDLILKLTTIFSTIIIQEKDPWNFTYSVLPLVCYIVIGLFIRVYNRKKRLVYYDKQKIIIATLLLFIGSYFFIAGLQEEEDYLRLNHAAWHIFGSGFAYFCLKSVTVSQTKTKEYETILEKEVNL